MATFLVYGQAIKHDFVGWDDGMLVYSNPAVKQMTPASIKWIFTHFDPELYIPLTFLTYQIDYAVGGGSALPFHLGNIVLHALNALLIVWFLYLISGKKWVAILCGAVFAFHPLNTEAVDWVSARKDVLSTFFFFSTLIVYLHWRDNPWPRTYVWGIVLFVLGLMAKVMVVTLPVVLVLIDLLQGRKLSKEMLLEKVWFLLPAIVFGLIALFGKTEVLASAPLKVSVLMAFKSAAFYLQKLFWPFEFSVLYPYLSKVTLLSVDFGFPIVLSILLGTLAWRMRRAWPELSFGLLFFLLTLFPTFTNVAKGSELDLYFASDRYAYVPQVGILYAFFAGLFRIVDTGKKSMLKPFLGCCAVLVIFLAALSYRQSQVWKNTETLFANVIRYYPSWSYIAHNNLGNAYRLKGEYDKAIDELQKSIEIRQHPRTLSNLGAVYRKLGQFDLAREQYDKALALSARSKEAHFGLGILYAAQHQYDQAIAEYNIAIGLDPSYEEAFSNRGVSQLAIGKLDDAIESFRHAIMANPYLAEARFNLGNTFSDEGRVDEAIATFQEAVRYVPGHIPTRINLGLLLYRQGDHDGARAQFEEILRIDPNNATAKKALQQMGRAS